MGADPWEQAEALGSWQLLQLPRGGGQAVLLNCESCRWASDLDSCRHPRLRPLAKARQELDTIVTAGRLALCYTVRHCDTMGPVTLEMLLLHDFSLSGLLSTPARVSAARAAVETLGFRMVYGKGEVVGGPDELDGEALRDVDPHKVVLE